MVPDNDAQVEAERVRWLAPLLDKISDQPTGIWLGTWFRNQEPVVNLAETFAGWGHTVPIFVLYGIPDLNCEGPGSGYSDAS